MLDLCVDQQLRDLQQRLAEAQPQYRKLLSPDSCRVMYFLADRSRKHVTITKASDYIRALRDVSWCVKVSRVFHEALPESRQSFGLFCALFRTFDESLPGLIPPGTASVYLTQLFGPDVLLADLSDTAAPIPDLLTEQLENVAW